MDSQMQISSHLPDLINNYISVRAQRLALDKEAASLKEMETEMGKTIIAKYRESGITAQASGMGLVKMTENIEPVVQGEDWPTLWGYIRETGDFSLLHKRITVTAVKEHWEAGEEIPGVGRATTYKLSVSGTK